MLTKELFEEGVAYAENNFIAEKQTHLSLDKSLIKEMFDLNGKKVLDFGCGMGGMTLWYAKNFTDSNVYGVDIDTHHIEIAGHLIRKHNINNIVCHKRNILEQPLQPHERFDFIFFNDVVEHIPLEVLGRIFRQVSEHLTENGKVFVTYPTWKGPYASHVTQDVKLYWCQFLPEKWLIPLIEKNNRTIVGELENDLVSVYRGLNKLTYRKLMKVLAPTKLRPTYRKTHSLINRLPLLKKASLDFFPFDFLITKEFLLLEPKK